MNKLLQKISSPLENESFAKIKDKIMAFINEHPDAFCILLLTIFCLFFLFWGLNFYPLIDVDETRYAVISRDLIYSFNWNNLNLNLVPFLEKPPLYFWLVGGSIKLFGGLTPFAARFPIASLAMFIVFFTYFFGKRVISRKFGMISALVLLTSMFFLILSHIAILDMVLTVFVTSAIYCGFLTHFSDDRTRKYFWWYTYLFMGLAFLSKGILGLVIPFAVFFVYGLITKTAKDIFKPVNMLPGIVIFLLISAPWHYIMYQEYGFRFIREYFLVHHFARFINSEYIGRERPFFYFVPVFLLGFMPWTFSFIAFVINGAKKIGNKYKSIEGDFFAKMGAVLDTSTNEKKLLVFSSLYFIIVFLLFSSSSTKLPTYILPVFPAAALLTGFYWWESDEKRENTKAIYITTLLFASLFIVIALACSVGFYFLPVDIQSQVNVFKHTAINAIYLLAIFMILRLDTKRALSIFAGYVLTMVFIITLAVSQIFNIVYSGGENEIVEYSRIARLTDTSLITFDFAVKPSVMVDYTEPVNFLTDADFDMLDRLLKSNLKPTFVIVKNKNVDSDLSYKRKINDRLKLVEKGEKYSLYYKGSKNKARNKRVQVFIDLIEADKQSPGEPIMK